MKFIQGGLQGADPEKGRFRHYLKGVLFHLLADQHQKKKRQPLGWHSELPEPVDGASTTPEAEAAFSVEAAYQDQGLGSELMGRVIRAARNRGVQRLYMSCLAENSKMQAIARKHEADLRFEYGEVVGEIVPVEPNYFSILQEAVEDRVSYMMTVLDLQQRRAEAA